VPAGADDLDPAHRMLRVRAETTKTRREQAGPHSAPTGVLAAGYLRHRAAVSRTRGPLFPAIYSPARPGAGSETEFPLTQIHAWRVGTLTGIAAQPDARLA
jgi:hypothetical protein